MAEKEGQRFGSYRLARLLGAGRFSEVYLGEHTYLGDEVALKLLPTRLAPDVQDRFLAEARMLKQLEHPQIIRVRDFGIEDEIVFLVMDFAPGGTVRALHPAGQSLPLSLVVSYVQQIASALQYVHEQKVIHRDLKPENLLLDQSGRILLGDFGLALVMSQSTDYAHVGFEGSLAYMAPEQFRGKPCPASDQYALAVIVYEWLSGTRPFHGTVAELCHAHLYLPPPPLSRHLLQVPPLVEQVVFAALSKDPSARFRDVACFATALTRAQRGEVLDDLLPLASSSSPLHSGSEANSSPHSQLPLALTTLIGREGQSQAIAHLLMQPEIRLLTLTGPGGIGKTSLALSVAHEVQEAFADGVCFVPLAAIHNPEFVLPSIAEALGQQTGNRPIFELVQAYLRERQYLLVLDNFEQVMRVAPHLTALLSTCPELTILVTSRETLHLQGEHEYPVPPLDLPSLTRTSDRASLAQNDAIALFVQRAKRSRPDFRLTEANARSIAEICIRLDGLPLALELAAARIKLLPPGQLLTRLSRSLHVLIGGRRDAPARQQTLRDTIKWSYDLLSVDEQRLFRRLCIFVGGCSLEAIEELYRRLGDESAGVFEGIASLLDKNLVKSAGQSREGPRILLLETIREFGLECLQECGELQQMRQSHAQYYLLWAETGCRELFGPEQLLWMTDLMQEMGNLRAVMSFVIAQQKQEMALYLGGALGPLWIFLGTSNQKVYLVEGTQFMQQVLEVSEGSVTSARARALVLYGGLGGWLGELERAESRCREGLALFRQLGDLQGVIHALWMLELNLFAKCDLRAAHQVAQEAATLSRRYPEVCTWWGADWTLGYSLFNVGNIALYDGSYDEGRVALEESIALCSRAGDRIFSNWSTLYLGAIAVLEQRSEEARGILKKSMNAFNMLEMKEQISEVQRFLGLLALRSGDIDQADHLLEESLRLGREVDDSHAIIWALIYSARAAIARQQFKEAQALLEEALSLARNRSDKLTLPSALEGLGFVVAMQGRPLWGTRFFGTAEGLRNVIGEPIAPIDRQEYDAHVAAIEAMLSHTAFQTAWKQGRRMSVEQVLVAPEERVYASAAPVPTVLPQEALKVGLTRRELDVMRLLAEGLSNAQIAQRLVLSTVTVNSYLRNIYSKLGVSTRTAALRYALDHHLI